MRTFNSKILLFGEYVLLKGAMGLAIPYPKYQGKLILPNDDTILSHENLESNTILKNLAIHIAHNEKFKYHNNLNQFLKDSLLGLYFESNIPNNYGLGSSGALTAAIYDEYFAKAANKKPDSNKYFKNELSVIESFFHAFSSGTDPLVSLLNIPIIIHAPVKTHNLSFPANIQTFLIDTQKESSTKSFMNIFNDKCEKRTIDIEKLIHTLRQFCDLEQKVFVEMFEVPEKLIPIINDLSGKLCIKLCGSGGGGYLLGFSKKQDFNEIDENFKHAGIKCEAIHFTESKLISI
jgi:mevalonate kinase